MNDKSPSQFDSLRDVLDYAIQKEQEAIDFYTDLAGKVKSTTLSAELHRIADMEVQHRERLAKMDVALASTRIDRPVTNLKLAEYLVDRDPSKEMAWQEIVTLAARKELEAMNLYTELSDLIADPPTRQLFANLAAEEARHKHFFETVYDDEVLREN